MHWMSWWTLLKSWSTDQRDLPIRGFRISYIGLTTVTWEILPLWTEQELTYGSEAVRKQSMPSCALSIWLSGTPRSRYWLAVQKRRRWKYIKRIMKRSIWKAFWYVDKSNLLRCSLARNIGRLTYKASWFHQPSHPDFQGLRCGGDSWTRTNGLTSLRSFGQVRNRRPASLPLAWLVAYYASASLHPPPAALRLRAPSMWTMCFTNWAMRPCAFLRRYQ